jgi:hypothetical protein
MPLTTSAIIDKTSQRRRTGAPFAPIVLESIFMAGPPQQSRLVI